MKFVSVVIVATIMLLGCGYDPANPPYDTKSNPDHFPTAALAVLDRIESDSLKTMEEITLAFADLYTENSDLLDNSKWRAVIDLLGLRLVRKGDIALELGVLGYTAAADYFALAAFARPGDSLVAARHNLFDAWRQMQVYLPASTSPTSLSLALKIEFARRFHTANQVSLDFFNSYLMDPLFGQESFSEDKLKQLTPTGLAFLDLIGFPQAGLPPALASFGAEGIELLAVEVNPVDSIYQMVELYFRPGKKISRELKAAFRVVTSDTAFRTISDPQRYIPFDFEPNRVSTEWPAGQVALASRLIPYSLPIEEVLIGLIDISANPPVPLARKGEEQNLVRTRIK